jgi:integrase
VTSKSKLTDGRAGTIAKMDAPATGQRFIFDDHRDAPRGFALRVTAAGGKAFVLSYTFEGRPRRKTVGDWPTWSLEAARLEAQRLIREIQTGTDPLEEKRRRRSEPTVAAIAEEWLEKHATGLKREKDVRKLILGDLVAGIGAMKVSDVRRRDVIEIVEKRAAATPRSASILLSYSRKMLDYATDRDYIAANPLAGLKPSAIKVPGKRDALKAVVRKRILDAQEIADFWQRAETCGLHRLTALALKLVLVTGQRPGEVAGLHESEIDGRIWTIPGQRRGKNATAQAVYLSDAAMVIVEAAKEELERLHVRRKLPWSGFLFEARPGAPITVAALSKALYRYSIRLESKDISGWGHWRPHDLRRTMRTGLSACGIRPDIAELVVGHAKTGIVAVYDHHGFDAEKRAALEAWERRLLAIVEGRDLEAAQSNVIQLRATA